MLEAWEDEEEERATRSVGQLSSGSASVGVGAGGGFRRVTERHAGHAPASPSAMDVGGLRRSSDPNVANSMIGSTAPHFDLEVVEGRVPGEVTCASAANDCVLVGTRTGAIVRYDYSDDYGAGEGRQVVQLSKTGKHEVSRVYLDGSSVHCLAVLTDKETGAAEYAYMNTVAQQPRLLTKLRGQDVASVAWCDIHSKNERLAGGSTQTGPILLGTRQGQILEVSVDDRDKKERSPKALHVVPGGEPVVGMEVSTFGDADEGILVVAVTPSRCYFFSSVGTTLEGLFARYRGSSGEGNASFLELPCGGGFAGGELHLFRNLKGSPRHLAWMAAPGIFHGQVELEGAAQADAQATYHTFLSNSALLDYGAGDQAGAAASPAAEPQRPLSVAITEYHLVLLFAGSLKVLNRISERVVHEEELDGNFRGVPLGLARDEHAQVVYLYTSEALYSLEVRNESQDVWRVYLEKGRHDLALENAVTVDQRNHVYGSKAKGHARRGEWEDAAKAYACVCGQPSFEEICLELIESQQPVALRTFLRERLRKMTPQERTQATMVSTWLTEIYLDQINAAYIRHGRDSKEHLAALEDLRSFLQHFRRHLDESTTSRLLSSYGHMEELIKYAGLVEDHETVVQNLIQRDRAEEAIGVLRNPAVRPLLWYKASPKLFLLEPHATVDAWIIAGKSLDPIKLLPSLLRASDDRQPAGPHHKEATRYLQHCISRMQNADCRVHNLLLSFLAKEEGEGPLLKYLTSEGLSASGEPRYDAKFALRLCMKMKKVRCCVQLYSRMGLFEEAVNNALHVDLELAKAVADRPEDDNILRKKLWLVIARHVIEQDKSDKGENIRKAIAFRRETDSLLKVEDILPFFPNFVLIDDFKEAIIQSLEEYNAQIEGLRDEMDEITEGTEALRQDIAAAASRVVTVPQGEHCAKCGEPVPQLSENAAVSAAPAPGGLERFYVFPSGHVYKTPCLVDLLVDLSPESTAREIQSLCANIPFLRDRMPSSVEPAPYGQEESCRRLDEILGQEDPYCGDLLVKSVSKPFVTEEERASGEVASWGI